MRELNSLSGGEWGKPPMAVFLQEEEKIPLRETNCGAVLKGMLGLGDSRDIPYNVYKRQ